MAYGTLGQILERATGRTMGGAIRELLTLDLARFFRGLLQGEVFKGPRSRRPQNVSPASYLR